MAAYSLVNPHTGQEYFNNSVDCETYDGRFSLIQVDGTLQAADPASNIRLPKAFMEDALYALAKVSLTDEFLSCDDRACVESLDAQWRESMKGLHFATDGTLEYTPSSEVKPDLPVRQTWLEEDAEEDDNCIVFDIRGGVHLWKPITTSCRTLQEDPSAEKITFRSNLTHAYDPSSERYLVTIRPEMNLGSTMLANGYAAQVQCRQEDLDELIESCKMTIVGYLSHEDNRPALHLGDNRYLSKALDDAGSLILKDKGLSFSHFRQADLSIDVVDLGECGQNEAITTEADVAKYSLITLDALSESRQRSRSSKQQVRNERTKDACRSLLDELLTLRPPSVSHNAWSETMDRALRVAHSTIQGILSHSLLADTWTLKTHARLLKGLTPEDLSKACFPYPTAISPSPIVHETQNPSEADMIEISAQIDTQSSKNGSRSHTSYRYIPLSGEYGNVVFIPVSNRRAQHENLLGDQWRVRNICDM